MKKVLVATALAFASLFAAPLAAADPPIEAVEAVETVDVEAVEAVSTAADTQAVQNAPTGMFCPPLCGPPDDGNGDPEPAPPPFPFPAAGPAPPLIT